jgi:hypothetical protein
MASGSMTLAEMIAQVRYRADMVDSQFCTDVEITSYLNQSLQSLYQKMVNSHEDYFVSATPQAITTTAAETYPLSATFYKGLGVDIYRDGQWKELPRFGFRERNRQTQLMVKPSFYRFSGANLWLIPTPEAGRSVRVWYVPRLTLLALVTDTVDMVSHSWLEYAILDSAIKCLDKEETDTTSLKQERAIKLQEVKDECRDRDDGEPEHVTDVYVTEEDLLPWAGSSS